MSSKKVQKYNLIKHYIMVQYLKKQIDWRKTANYLFEKRNPAKTTSKR